MSALPARRIASSALCAALLVGITGPVAMAADSARGHAHVAPDARLPGAEARLAQIAKLNWGELTPVADLLNAVLDSNGLLPASEARKLGAEAKAALAEAAAKDPRSPVTSTVVLLPAPVPPALVPAAPERRAADPVTDLLDLVLGAVDSLLQAITSGVGGILPSVDDLLNGVDDLLAGLIGGNLVPQDEPASSTPSSTSSTSVSTPTPEAVTYPAVTLLPPAQPTAS
ncbi:hypothetical protein [Streptomyces coeruleorubidus]|uniref:hypothetical protein n=1 Tax=Streptomyces coeruleorubidus TaxID=116188 RepID=UPI00378B45ED